MKYLVENMNIALVHDWLTNMAGGERVLLEMSKVYSDAPIYTSIFDPKGAKDFAGKDVRPSFLQRMPIISKMVKSKREFLIPLTPFAFEQTDLSKFDLVVSSCSFPSKGVLTKPDTIHICYCHTPARYLWEPEIDSRAKSGWMSSLRKNTARRLRTWDRVAATRVDHYIANSNYIASRIKKYYGRDSIVIYPPVDIDRFKPTEPKKIKDYYLFVSRLVDYKKCDLVIEAFNDLKLPLIVIGRGPDKKRLEALANSNITFMGFLSDKEIKKYYAEAKAFVFAAEEDFGIVPVEAMAAGRPVIAFKGGGVCETVIDKETGILFEEQTPQCLIDAIKKFNPNEFDSAVIRKQAEKFSNERFQRELRKTINDILTKEGKS